MTIVSPDWPYQFSWHLLLLLIWPKAAVIRWRHPGTMGFGKLVVLLALANVAAILAGSWLCHRALFKPENPFGQAEFTWPLAVVWLLSSVVEYGVILAVTRIKAFPLAKTCLLLSVLNGALVFGASQWLSMDVVLDMIPPLHDSTALLEALSNSTQKPSVIS